MRPVDLMAEVGNLLYGDQWQQPLAQDLAIESEILNGWMTGSHLLSVESPSVIRCRDLLDLEVLRLVQELQAVHALRMKFERVAAEQAPTEAIIYQLPQK